MYTITIRGNEDEYFTLQETPRNIEFIEAFRDTSRDLHGHRFTLDVIHGWEQEENIITFTITPQSQILLQGKDFQSHESALDRFFQGRPSIGEPPHSPDQ
ncbi:hypothetical protein ACUY2L_06960 [Corynebacterium mastitidis]